MFNKKKNNKGFTLVELLVVIAIIGILAVVAVPSLMKNIDKAKAADVIADYSTIKSVVVSQYTDGSLKADEYNKATNTMIFTAKTDANNNKIDVNDLSKEPAYKLTVTTPANANATAILEITVKNADMATKIATEIGCTPNSNTVTVELLK